MSEVHELKVRMWTYDKTEEKPGWYFWNEPNNCASRTGPFKTKAKAQAEFEKHTLRSTEAGLVSGG